MLSRRVPPSRSAPAAACIDQTDIDANLQALPVFLAGSRKLLVLAGETYASRLWCVMELFVFVRMNGAFEDIDVRLLSDEGDLRARLLEFDAGKSRCFLLRDRQRLLAVIEASFGTFAPFNSIVRSILAKKLDAA